jgi:hypothetical protein
MLRLGEEKYVGIMSEAYQKTASASEWLPFTGVFTVVVCQEILIKSLQPRVNKYYGLSE